MLLQRELYAVPSAAFCLGEEQIGAQQINNSCTFCYLSPLHTNLDRRSTEPTEITPFLGNFPDSTLSSPSRTANALILGLAGVCRDFAHLAIAFCRSLGIPARFVSAYAYGLNPPDFHAYIEAFLGGRWILFDPTRLAPQSSFVRIGQGRDAADTSFATIFGGAVMNKMELSMQPSTGQRNSPEYTTAPISNYPSAAQSQTQSNSESDRQE